MDAIIHHSEMKDKGQDGTNNHNKGGDSDDDVRSDKNRTNADGTIGRKGKKRTKGGDNDGNDLELGKNPNVPRRT